MSPSTRPVLGEHPTALTPWVELLDLTVPPGDTGSLVRLEQAPDDPEAVELGVLPLEGIHPAELLEGFVAPASWVALGVVCPGWASPVGAGSPSGHPARRRVTTTVLVDRAGNVAGRLRWEDESTLDVAPPEGEVVRLLLAAMCAA
jgi:hypothetical protein